MKIIQFSLFALALSFISFCRGEENSGLRSGRITGGWDAVATQLPFVAGVHHNGEFICTGVILHKDWVITSATCVSGLAGPLVQVKIGGILLDYGEPGSIPITVRSIHFHWGFNPTVPQDVYEYNLALLELASSVPIGNPLMSPIKRSDAEVVVGTRLYLAGWGGQSDLLPVDTLQYTDQVTVMELLDCSVHIGTFLDTNYMCTTPFPMHTACHFDEGGPLFSVDTVTGQFLLLGIVSYTPCTTPTLPTIYSALYSANNKLWINKLVPE